ncbi:MAG: hypothetical protein FWG91_06000 [Lachnospiraceae bacterium]|nr:hypothetical protein [Lachnospiraceae bacterium]
MKRLVGMQELNRPVTCSLCEGVVVFKGLGQFKCEECGNFEYDDYGKAREFIEKMPGANVYQIAEATGVSRKAINNMIKDGRFEITRDSKSFLVCEVCGVNIRSGRACQNCEAAYHKAYEEDLRRTNIKGGFGKAERNEDAEGHKRFRREV